MGFLDKGNMLKAAKALMASVMQMGASAKMAAAAGQVTTKKLFFKIYFFNCFARNVVGGRSKSSQFSESCVRCNCFIVKSIWYNILIYTYKLFNVIKIKIQLWFTDDLLGNPHNPGFRDAMTGARDDVLHAGHYLNAAVKGEMTDVASQVSSLLVFILIVLFSLIFLETSYFMLLLLFIHLTLYIFVEKTNVDFDF